jgi:hypothetical protein
MSNMHERRRVAKSYECPFCGRIDSIEFEVASSHNGGTFDRESVVDYGDCKVAAAATNPRNPHPSDLATCPIFKSGA